jgi:prefoldin subunit 5
MSLSAELKRLSNVAFQLEEENERLRAEIEQLKSQPQESEAVKHFLDLIKPEFERVEKLKGNGPNLEKQIAAFRVVRPR